MSEGKSDFENSAAQPERAEVADAEVAPFAAARGYLADAEEKHYAFVAHLLGALTNACTAGLLLPALAPLTVLLVTRRRTPFILFHINQAFVFQAVMFTFNLALAVVFALIAVITCGVGKFLFVFNLVPPTVALIYGVVVAFEVRGGAWCEYAIVGDRVLQMKKPIFR